jgi:putative restriction endonuclease
MADLADYLDLTVGQARQQFRELMRRSPVSSGRQVVFLPVETLLCLAASVLAKMANLDGSRAHGGKWDVLAGAMLRDDPVRFTDVYRVLLTAARAEGMGQDRLPDFLGLEYGGEFALLGQNELQASALERAFKAQIAQRVSDGVFSEKQTEQIILAAARVGQHVFALNVLSNCGQRCVFCGLNPSTFGAKRMLVAGHIKPWKDSAPASAWIPGTAWPPAPATTSPSTPVCSPSA